eukprot:1176869-Prorocentrum_minimum.AAC.2
MWGQPREQQFSNRSSTGTASDGSEAGDDEADEEDYEEDIYPRGGGGAVRVLDPCHLDVKTTSWKNIRGGGDVMILDPYHPDSSNTDLDCGLPPLIHFYWMPDYRFQNSKILKCCVSAPSYCSSPCVSPLYPRKVIPRSDPTTEM